MSKAHLTDRTVKALSTEEVQEDFWDTTLPGFGLRVSESGRKAFVARYRAASGKRRRVTIGQYPSVTLAQARAKAKNLIGSVAMGVDPVAEAEEEARSGYTFRELADEYMSRHAERRKSQRSIAEDRRQLDKDVLPVWGDRPVADITKRDVIELLNAIADRGAPVQANRTRALVHRVFNFGLEEDLTDVNPAFKVKQRVEEEARDRVLSETEIRKLWNALPTHASPAVGALFKLLLLTAQRPGEIKRMRWAEVSRDVWEIPREHYKSKRAHVVPLSPQALVVVESMRGERPREWVLRGRKRGRLDNYRAGVHALRDHLAFSDHWRVQDIRRSVTTHMGALGVSRFVRARILGHADVAITSVYDRYAYLKEKREGLEAWAARLDEIVR